MLWFRIEPGLGIAISQHSPRPLNPDAIHSPLCAPDHEPLGFTTLQNLACASPTTPARRGVPDGPAIAPNRLQRSQHCRGGRARDSRHQCVCTRSHALRELHAQKALHPAARPGLNCMSTSLQHHAKRLMERATHATALAQKLLKGARAVADQRRSTFCKRTCGPSLESPATFIAVPPPPAKS